MGSKAKAEVNQALMNEIALLSSLIRARQACHPQRGRSGVFRDQGQQSCMYRPENYKQFHNSHMDNTTPKSTAVPIATLQLRKNVAFSNDTSTNLNGSSAVGTKMMYTNNRYKIDRRVKMSSEVPKSCELLETVGPPKPQSPKKFDIVNKYYLKRRRSLSTSQGLDKLAAAKLQVTKLSLLSSPHPSRIRRPNHQRIANRVLQRSIHRLRPGGNPVCSFFKQFGTCQRQEHCPYLHVQHISQLSMRKAMKKLRKGIKPACVFHLRGGCATINCPFPHVSPEEERSEKEKNKVKEAKRKQELKPKRYYQQNLNLTSDCISMVVPRNTRHETKVTVTEPLPGDILETAKTVSKSSGVEVEVATLDLRRERLMGKIALLKSRYANANTKRTCEISAPEFLPFKK